MEQFKGNSNASKEKNNQPPKERVKLEPLAGAGQVIVKKESEFKKFKNQFFTEDAKSVKGHIFTQVVIPGIQKLISDSIKNGIDWLIYGVRGISSQGGSKNVTYTNFYDRNKAANTPLIPNSASKQNVYSVSDAVFVDRGIAEETLLRLKESIDRYGMASVADFYDLIEQPHAYTECKYGWRNLDDATIDRVRDGYSIKFPKIIVIE